VSETSEPPSKPKPTHHEVKAKKSMEGSLHGGRVRAGHRATLFGILGERYMVPIRSAGRRFFMIGSFPYRSAIEKVAHFSKIADGADRAPTRENYREWADEFNQGRVKPTIQIAATDDNINVRTFMALIGGANHEGFHRLYSGQCPIRGNDLEKAIAPYYNSRIPYSDPETLSLLMESQNIFEDIRIERIGCAEFPGVYTKMADLADFILDQEEPTRERDRKIPPSPARIALAVFREVGLGYSTEKTREALAHYKSVCPEVVEMIRTGALAPLLKDAIPNVGSEREIRIAKLQFGISTELAFRLLSVLHELAWAPEPAKPEPSKPQDEKKAAAEIITSDPSGLKDYASALESVLSQTFEDEDSKMEEGEKPYRPYSTTDDRVVMVGGNEKEARRVLKEIVASTKSETSYLRSKLRNMFRALENGDHIHGVRKGTRLSERYLVDSYVTVLGGREPSRAFIEETEVIDTSLSAIIVLDESSSMKEGTKPINTKRALYILSDGLSSIGAKFAIAGFRVDMESWKDLVKTISWSEAAKYHRVYPITYDVFKGFEERYQDVAWRLGNLVAQGGTPMADGIEFGLKALSTRKEGHRTLFIVTDGEPDPEHEEVIKGQIRRAKEAGIHLVGVGLGEGSKSVQTLFEDHVYASELKDMPKLLVKKLEWMVSQFGTTRRGKTVSNE